MDNKNISSAEMTAYWRCQYPLISGDSLSEKLASNAGIQKAHEFEKKYQYPLIGRKISVRAGWCLQQATEVLLTGKYDACISLGSGFSFLSYYIALAINDKQPKVKYFDVDLSEIIQLRKARIAQLPGNILNPIIANKIETIIVNLENAYQQGIKFTELFSSCNAPVFVIEGIIYFLSKGCVQWIYDGIASYKNAAVIFDYWPAAGPDISKCFKRVIDSLDDFIPEKICGLLSDKELESLCKKGIVKNARLQDVEEEFSKKMGEPAQLINQDEFIPVKLAVSIVGSR